MAMGKNEHEKLRGMIKRLDLEKSNLISFMIEANEDEWEKLDKAFDLICFAVDSLEKIKEAEAVDVDA